MKDQRKIRYTTQIPQLGSKASKLGGVWFFWAILLSTFYLLLSAGVANAATVNATLVPNFQVNLTNTLRPELGSGLPTFSRASTAYVVDWEGVLRQAISGEARFTGARRVRNGLAVSENFSSATWSKINAGTGVAPVVTAGQTDPNGGLTAYRVQLDAGTGAVGNFSSIRHGSIPVATGGYLLGSVWAKTNDGSTKTICFNMGQGKNVTVGPNWQRVSSATWTSASPFMDIGLGDGNGTSLTADLIIWHAQTEDVTGQSNQNPSEYVSVGVLPAPYYGANVDGVKYFDTLNGNTVSSSVVTENKGGKITSSAPGASASTTDSSGPLGYLAEGARTNVITQSQTLNTTWTQSQVSVTADQTTAPDGTLTADLMTGTSGTTYHRIVNQPGSSGSTGTGSLYIKAGTAPFAVLGLVQGANEIWVAVNMSTGVITQTGATGGSTYTSSSITALPNGWYRVTLTGTLATTPIALNLALSDTGTPGGGNPSAVTGTTLYAWGAQLEESAFTSSYIPTTTGSATRNADALSYKTSGNIQNSAGTAYAEIHTNVTLGQLYLNDATILIDAQGQSTIVMWVRDSGGTVVINSRDSAGNTENNPSFSTSNVIHRAAVAWGNNNITGATDGVNGGNSGVYNGTILYGSGNLTVGTTFGGASPYWFGTIRNLKIWKKVLTNTQLRDMTSTNSGVARNALPQTTPKAPSNGSLVGYWPMNDGAGTKAGDASGNGNTGTLQSSPTWINGKIGKALRLNGSNQYVSVPYSAVLAPSNAITVSSWVRTSNWNPGAQWQGVVLATNNNGLHVHPSAPYIRFQLYIGGNESVDTGNLLPNTWYHVVGTYDKDGGANNMKVWVNGVLAQQRTLTGTFSISDGWWFGNYSAGTRFLGDIDEVRIYNRSLSATEIQNLYKSSGGVINVGRNNFLTSGLIGLWSLDGKDMNWGTNKALDRSGNANDGLLTNLSTTTSPVGGRIGQALKFNGSSSYISTPSPTSFSALTVGGWVKFNSLSNAFNGFIGSNISGSPNASGFTMWYNVAGACPGNSLNIFIRTSSTNPLGNCGESVSSVPTVGRWYHLMMTWDSAGDGKVRFYQDGTLFYTSTGSSNTAMTGVVSRFPIGALQWADSDMNSIISSQTLNGIIDDVRIYNRALSASEVKQLYNLGR